MIEGHSAELGEAVNSPSHYTFGGIETIDFIRAKLGPEGFRAYCIGNVLKYVTRWQHKNGEEDLKKALKYMEWVVEALPDTPEVYL